MQRPLDIGYFEGGKAGLWFAGPGVEGAVEVVFDLYDFESAAFGVAGFGGQTAVGWEGSAYVGIVWGWSSYEIPRIDNYSGWSVTASLGVAFPIGGIGASVAGFGTQKDDNGAQLFGLAVDINGGGELELPVTVTGTAEHAWMIPDTKKEYYDRHPDGTKEIRREHGVLFAADILSGGGFMPGRAWAATAAIMNAELWEQAGANQP